MAFGPYEAGLAVLDWHRGVKALAPLGALTLRCGEKSSHQKTGLDVGIVKSAVADPADVLAGYVSKMWSHARNSLALDRLDGARNFGIHAGDRGH
jgi:hypothetical protein